ncbi:MAG: hypothetical protein F8N39_14900 [Clostridiaceae bacterium]|nr:hypothetical protein [Clostridiaceae bacterium]
MSNMLDKNGKPLKGATIWTRTISLDGGLEAHDKKVAMEAFSDFLDSRPNVSTVIAQDESKERRRNLKIVK